MRARVVSQLFYNSKFKTYAFDRLHLKFRIEKIGKIECNVGLCSLLHFQKKWSKIYRNILKVYLKYIWDILFNPGLQLTWTRHVYFKEHSLNILDFFAHMLEYCTIQYVCNDSWWPLKLHVLQLFIMSHNRIAWRHITIAFTTLTVIHYCLTRKWKRSLYFALRCVKLV